MTARVLHIINSFQDIGGAEVSLIHLLRRFDREKFELSACALFGVVPAPGQFGLPSIGIQVFGFDKHRYYADWRPFADLIRFIRQGKFDIVHTHLNQANLVGRMAAVLTGTPVILATEHNIWRPRRLAAHLVNRALAKCTTRIVAISPSIRDSFIANDHISADRIAVIPNGVPFDQCRVLAQDEIRAMRREFEIPERHHVVCAIARLVPQKGLSYLLEAARKVLDRGLSVTFLVVGDGPLWAYLQAQAESLSLKGAVRFLGKRTDVYEVLQVSDLLCMSSLWEGLPTVAIQAHGVRRPIVATQVGGCGDVVRDRISGRLVPPADPLALSEAIAETLADRDLANQMGECGYTWVTERFSIQATTRRMEALYLETLRDLQRARV